MRGAPARALGRDDAPACVETALEEGRGELLDEPVLECECEAGPSGERGTRLETERAEPRVDSVDELSSDAM